ncbi:hypothetical protein [Streptomyces sp. x-80]|uniref:hypothetical protein n=1 Tax=Streptomyces sp. x-80 TaxID=2789282 RepID=UPI003980428C
MTTEAHAAERQIPAWIPTVGPGWTDLLDQLHRDLSALDPAYRIEAFGTQLGCLRITVADRFEADEFDGEYADQAAALTDVPAGPTGHPGEGVTSGMGQLRARPASPVNRIG